MNKIIDVVAAILIDDNGRVLIARRKKGKYLEGYWEFPGGKIERGETPEESLKRELKEEMNIDIKVGDFLGESIHKYEDKKIRLLGYISEIQAGEIILKDHDEYKWLKVQSLNTYKLAPADIPFLKKLYINSPS